MHFKSLLLICLLAPLAAFAQNRPNLSRFSDSQLLREMDYRGYSCDQRRDDAIVINIACDPYTNALVELYNADGDKVASAKYFTGSTSACANMRDTIMSETENGRLYQTKTIAFCDPYTNMIKIRFSSTSIKEVEKTFQGSTSACAKAVDQFNALF